jgi:hypothetical protein
MGFGDSIEFAAAMSYGGLKRVTELYADACARQNVRPGRLMSHIPHIGRAI